MVIIVLLVVHVCIRPEIRRTVLFMLPHPAALNWQKHQRKSRERPHEPGHHHVTLDDLNLHLHRLTIPLVMIQKCTSNSPGSAMFVRIWSSWLWVVDLRDLIVNACVVYPK